MTPLAVVLERLERISKSGDGYIARCPAHEDNNPSLKISEGNDGQVLLHCHAGCELDAVCTALRLTLTDLWPAKETPLSRNGHAITAVYPYADENGHITYEVVREHPKSFKARQPQPDGTYLWKRPQTRYPYRLPELLVALADQATIYVTEGEKDADRLWTLGYAATTNDGGAKKWTPAHATWLVGAKRVIIVADADQTGHEHAEKVRDTLVDLVATVSIVVPVAGNDVSDHLDAGYNIDQLRPYGVPERAYVTWRAFRSDTPTDISWLVRGLIAQGGLAVLGSTPKAGKTWIAAHLALCVCTGHAFLGRFVVPEARNVHYLGLEGSSSALRHRFGALARGIGVDPDGDELADSLAISYKPKGASLSDRAWATSYCSDVLAHGAALAIVDTARRAARIRESAEGVEDLQLLALHLEPLTRAGVTILFLHHSRKVLPQGGVWVPPLERLSGTSDWAGITEVGFVLDRARGTGWRSCRLEIDGRDIPTYLPLRVTYEGEGSGENGLLSYTDTLRVRAEEEDAEAVAPGVALDVRAVAAWLSQQPLVQASLRDIAAEFNVDVKTVRNYQHALSLEGVAQAPEKGVRGAIIYQLVSPAYGAQRP